MKTKVAVKTMPKNKAVIAQRHLGTSTPPTPPSKSAAPTVAHKHGKVAAPGFRLLWVMEDGCWAVLSPFALLTAFFLLACQTASAQTTVTNFSYAPGAYIPDASASGLADTRNISTPITSITGVRVHLKITGTFGGDIYAWLSHSSGRTVLLNRVGRRASSDLGYGDQGFDVTFDDAATNGDVHVYRQTIFGNNSTPLNGPLTNSWAPDARTTSPFSVLNTDSRSAFLNSFTGLDPNGQWVLFVADVEAGDIHTLDSWSLEITGYTTPNIVSQPVNQTSECSSGNATFTVTAGGSSPLSYQWRFNANPITDATNSSVTISGTTFTNAGNYDVVVTSPYGAITSSVATLTVIDTTAPVADVTPLPDVTGQCSATIPSAPTAHDACDGLITATTGDPLSYSAQGDFTVHWTYTDSHSNVTTQTQMVRVHDTTPPVIALVGASTVTVECHDTYSDQGATASDNCDGNITTNIATVNPVNSASVGTYTVTYNVHDAAGNAAIQVSRTVNVVDTKAPVPTLASLPAVTGQCSASVTAPTANDACDGPITGTTSDPLTYTNQGDFTVHWTYTDVHGNATNQTQAVHVHDTTAPVITLAGASSVTVECHSTYTDAGATASDNCDGNITSRIATNNPVNTTVLGNYTVTYNVSDLAGNPATQVTRTVHVVDTTPPVITWSFTNMTLSANGTCQVPVPDVTGTNGILASDICSSALTITQTPATNAFLTLGTNQVVIAVDDGNGNIAYSTNEIVVTDTTPPTLTILGANPLTNECHMAFSDPGASATDNCSGLVSLTTNSTVNANAVGSYTITYVATDAAGNSTTNSRTVYVQDTTPPIPDLASLSPVTGQCSATVPAAPTATDACDGPITATTGDPLTYSSQGDYTVHWTYTDSHGNVTNQTQAVHVHDTTAPVITLVGASPVTVECHGSYSDQGATASDNCDGDITSRIAVNNPVNPNVVGAYTVTYNVADTVGNHAVQVTRTVNVVDTTPPVITCSSNITVYTTNASGVAVTFTTTATDTCSASPTVVSTPASGSTFAVGTTTVQSVATDDTGNTNTCSFTVTVIFNNPPTTAPIALGVLENHPTGLTFDKLLSYDADPDNENLTITSVNSPSTNGASVVLTSTNVIYSPVTNYVGADQFTYIVSDNFGGIAYGSVLVQVVAETGSSQNLIGVITIDQAGAHMRFAAVPGLTYTIERSTDGLTWTAIQSVTAAANGQIVFTDTATTSGPAYYRTSGP